MTMQFNNIINKIFLLFVFITICVIRVTRSAKILGLFPHASESHFMVMRTLVMELAKRDHHLHLISGHRLDEKHANIQEFIIEPEFQFWQEVQKQAGVKQDLQALSELDALTLDKALAKAGFNMGLNFFSNSYVQELLQLSVEQFDYDLIIMDLFYTEALLTFGYYFRTPVVAIMSIDFNNYMHQVQESMVPSACLPFKWQDNDINLNYWERLSNLQQCLNRRKSFQNNNYAQQKDLIHKFFNTHISNNNGLAPTVMELHKQLSLLLINNYIPLTPSRPLLANMLLVGGLQVSGARELPWNVKRFLDEARNGVIYIHLGDHHLCSTISKTLLDVLFNVLAKTHLHIIWTCHDVKTFDNLPKNIFVQHMVAQTDILAHPHVKLFITNGDLLGLQESIMRMVPILGLPLFINEHENLKLVEKLQIGLRLDYTNITETSLAWALNHLIGNEFFILNIRDISKMFRDRPLTGLSTTIFWLDYILKYGSSPLHAPMIGIPIYQIHLIDLIFYYIIVTLILALILTILYYTFVLVRKNRKNHKIITKIN